MSFRPGSRPSVRASAAAVMMAARLLLFLVYMPSSLLQGQTAGAAPSPSTGPKRNILFFGDSLTAGYGLADPATEAFPALIQQCLNAAGLNYNVANAGVSGDTSSGGLRRIDWSMRQPVDIFVLELGGNDGLRGLPVADTRRNLQAIIDRVKARYPAARIVVAGMRMPPNFGVDYTTQFAEMYPELVKANPGSTLLPFLLQGVGGIARYNQRDEIHPTAEGHRLIADTLWTILEPMCRNVAPGA
jgi:acyl-CoA thioesterase-1